MAYELHHRLFGIAHGNFRPLPERSVEFVSTFEELRKRELPTDLDWVFAPRVYGMHAIAEMNGEHGDDFSWGGKLVRTTRYAGGGVVIGPMTGVAIFNADGLTVTLHQDDVLAHLHCGYRTLIREEPNAPSVIEVAVKRYFDATRVRASIWDGIGPCCWAPEFTGNREIWQPKTALNHGGLLEECIGQTTRSPFGNRRQTADLYKLARLLLLHAGVSEEHIAWHPVCTCCALEHGRPVYWSHTRYKKLVADKVPNTLDGRNASLVWLTHVRSLYTAM